MHTTWRCLSLVACLLTPLPSLPRRCSLPPLSHTSPTYLCPAPALAPPTPHPLLHQRVALDQHPCPPPQYSPPQYSPRPRTTATHPRPHSRRPRPPPPSPAYVQRPHAHSVSTSALVARRLLDIARVNSGPRLASQHRQHGHPNVQPVCPPQVCCIAILVGPARPDHRQVQAQGAHWKG
jgi:hypothetical protein